MSNAFIYHNDQLWPVIKPHPVSLDSLLGIDSQKSQLLENTDRFVAGKPANNALLWGVKGMGKSSLVRSMALRSAAENDDITAIEIPRQDIENLLTLYLRLISESRRIQLIAALKVY